MLTGPVLVKEPGVLGGTQGFIAMIFAATGSKRFLGTMLPGSTSRVQVPSLSWRVVSGSYSGSPAQPKVQSPVSESGVGVWLVNAADFFSISFWYPKKKNVLLRPL